MAPSASSVSGIFQGRNRWVSAWSGHSCWLARPMGEPQGWVTARWPVTCKGPSTQVEGHGDLREEPCPPERSVCRTGQPAGGWDGVGVPEAGAGVARVPLSSLSFLPDTWRSSQGGAENRPADLSRTSQPLFLNREQLITTCRGTCF